MKSACGPRAHYLRAQSLYDGGGGIEVLHRRCSQSHTAVKIEALWISDDGGSGTGFRWLDCFPWNGEG